jgi:hypothetical protein
MTTSNLTKADLRKALRAVDKANKTGAAYTYADRAYAEMLLEAARVERTTSPNERSEGQT